MIYCKQSTTGFSLIEVLVALLIFSLGLIGLAGILVMSTQANHGAFIRTQATFLAQNMADRMRTNPIGVWQGDYNGTWPMTGTMPTCDASNPCAPNAQALRDNLQWDGMLKQYLPNDSNLQATINCAAATGTLDMTRFYQVRPPYAGVCTMNVSWTERSLAIGGSPSTQTFTWTFQP